MACTNSFSSSTSWPNRYAYDVFLSFRGEDTRYSFTDHLYHALVRAGLRTFRDNDEIYRGQQLKPEIERAITKSKAFIIVLSQNFANSRWCLDELVLILEQRRNFNHFVLPVFYHVDTSDVRNQRRSYAIEVEDGVQGSHWTEYNVNRWKAALTDIANLTGMLLSGPETNFIAEIVDVIDCKLDLKLVGTPSQLTGIETRAEGINSWLTNEQSGAECLAICGMGGSGKTTLAQYVYILNKHKFDSSSFLQEVGKNFQQSLGLLGLQKQLLRDLLGGKNIKLSTVSEGTSMIEKTIQMKRVFIVLDDIDEHAKLATLLGTKTSHTQSKIIITTRLLDTHSWFGSISWSCQVYKLELLNDHESLELLSHHAFGFKIPRKGFAELAVRLAWYCEGNPLALKVLGSSVFVSAEDPRENKSVLETWMTTLSSLDSLKGDIDHKIQGILRRSFDSLPDDSHRELFLHIARFFVGEYEDDVVRMLEDDWRVKSGIMTLINRCLLTISPSKKLMMHQLLQVMGRNIVREKSKDPAEVSRVWHDNETYRVFEKGGGSETIDSLALDVQKLKEVTEALALKTVSLANIEKQKWSDQVTSFSNVTSLHRSLVNSVQPCHRFSFTDIQSATQDFDDNLIIGEGGYGKVYKGLIKIQEIGDIVDIVAIKRLSHMSHQGEAEFIAELEVLSKLRHCHLVSLFGYCYDNKEMILVYAYMSNGSLYNHLHETQTSLSWVQRLKIGLGAGRGLDYIHTGFGTQNGVIHRDVKSSNILLDENLEAKISDFGLSRICQTNHSSSYVETVIKGTFGYLDPQYYLTGRVSRKSDVYAFGVVLFELLSGRHARRLEAEEELGLAKWAQKCVKDKKLDRMVDSNIRGTIFPKCLRRFTQIAAHCLHSVPKERPTMTEVVASLQDILELQVDYDYSAGHHAWWNLYK